MGRVVTNAGHYTSLSIVANDTMMKMARPIRSSILRWNTYTGGDLLACFAPLIKDVGNAAEVNNGFVSSDYTESTGLTDDGTKWLGPQFNMTDIGTDNSCHIGIYLRTRTGAVGGSLGTYDGTNYDVYSYQTGTTGYCGLHTATTGLIAYVGSAIGHQITSRIASNDFQLYKNGVSVASNATPGGTRVGGVYPFLVHAYNNIGVAAVKQIGASAGYHVGTGLTAAQTVIFYNAVQRGQTILGRQV